jgi:hypothetical protein
MHQGRWPAVVEEGGAAAVQVEDVSDARIEGGSSDHAWPPVAIRCVEGDSGTGDQAGTITLGGRAWATAQGVECSAACACRRCARTGAQYGMCSQPNPAGTDLVYWLRVARRKKIRIDVVCWLHVHGTH